MLGAGVENLNNLQRPESRLVVGAKPTASPIFDSQHQLAIWRPTSVRIPCLRAKESRRPHDESVDIDDEPSQRLLPTRAITKSKPGPPRQGRKELCIRSRMTEIGKNTDC